MNEFRVELSPRARAQFVSVQRWWIENRRAAPDLLVLELEDAMRILVTSPNFGEIYRFVPRIRKVLLGRTRYGFFVRLVAEDPLGRGRSVGGLLRHGVPRFTRGWRADLGPLSLAHHTRERFVVHRVVGGLGHRAA